ncbi:hypothetical protein G6F43_002666 [Rhizopus delemar]|nr:hypothetical protein G6F43_002666 [Rhizopus delemar]
MSVIVEPSEELLFHSPFTRLSKESLFVKNLNDHPIIFKVKTTAPKQYCVRPNAGRIEPKSEIEVQIILQPFKEEPAEDYKCKDKFLVQTATLNESLEQQDISSMWSYIESTDRQSMHQHKIKCVFVGPKKEENELMADDNVGKTAATTTTTTTTSANTDADKTATDATTSAITAAAATTGITATEQEPSEQVTANKEESQIPSHNDVIPTSIVPPVPQQPAPPVEEEAQVPSEPLQPTPIAAVPVREIEQEKESEEKKRLREALETIKRLEKEIEQLKKSQDEGLRERKEVVGGRKLAPTVQPLDAVHQHLAQLEKPRAVEGYPPQVMLGVAILVFIFTYLFF